MARQTGDLPWETNLQRRRKFPNGTNSLPFVLVDDTFEGVILLSWMLECGWLATDLMDYFPLFSFPHFLHISEAKRSLGEGGGCKDVTGKRDFFFRKQRSPSDPTGGPRGAQSTVGRIISGHSPNVNKATLSQYFHTSCSVCRRGISAPFQDVSWASGRAGRG